MVLTNVFNIPIVWFACRCYFVYNSYQIYDCLGIIYENTSHSTPIKSKVTLFLIKFNVIFNQSMDYWKPWLCTYTACTRICWQRNKIHLNTMNVAPFACSQYHPHCIAQNYDFSLAETLKFPQKIHA